MIKIKLVNRFQEIKKYYRELVKNLSKLLELERKKTFPPIQLDEWIRTLEEFNLSCPCSLFDYIITPIRKNCLFYKCYDIETWCDYKCHSCGVECDYCERASHWSYISFYSSKLDGLRKFRRKTIWKLLTCLSIAEALKEIKNSQNTVIPDSSTAGLLFKEESFQITKKGGVQTRVR